MYSAAADNAIQHGHGGTARLSSVSKRW